MTALCVLVWRTIQADLYYHNLCKCAVWRFWWFMGKLYPKEGKRRTRPFLPVWCDSVTLHNFPLHPLYTLYNIILSMSSIAIFPSCSSSYSPKNISPNTGRQAVQLLPNCHKLPCCEKFNKLLLHAQHTPTTRTTRAGKVPIV